MRRIFPEVAFGRVQSLHFIPCCRMRVLAGVGVGQGERQRTGTKEVTLFRKQKEKGEPVGKMEQGFRERGAAGDTYHS